MGVKRHTSIGLRYTQCTSGRRNIVTEDIKVLGLAFRCTDEVVVDFQLAARRPGRSLGRSLRRGLPGGLCGSVLTWPLGSGLARLPGSWFARLLGSGLARIPCRLLGWPAIIIPAILSPAI